MSEIIQVISATLIFIFLALAVVTLFRMLFSSRNDELSYCAKSIGKIILYIVFAYIIAAIVQN